MTCMNMLPFIDLIEDLNRELTPGQRHQRVVEAIHAAIRCDAVALLRLDRDSLRPVAVIGLRHEAIGRRFDLNQHPRLSAILTGDGPVRFPANSDLPDPYDGLIEAEQDSPHVHDCLGCAVRVGGELWGALTLDALAPDRFDGLKLTELRAYVAATSAAILTSQTIEALRERAAHNSEVARHLIAATAPQEMIGDSPCMRALQEETHTVAPSGLSVLITGETGVGKDLVARSIHRHSRRAEEALVQVNCAALAESVVESELFGHVRGAFTGALRDRLGHFELADKGSLYLDEVGELPLAIQAKLLRALQNGEIQAVGSDRIKSVDVRIIAATNRNLQEEVAAGRFRDDLYHRLSVYPLAVPPLRERGRDIEALAGHFLERLQHKLGYRRLRLSRKATALLRSYAWPGNVRELEHMLARAALKAASEQGREARIISVTPHHLDISQHGPHAGGPDVPTETAASPGAPCAGAGLRDQTEAFQRQLIIRQLEASGGNLAAAARALRVDRSNLARTLLRLGIT